MMPDEQTKAPRLPPRWFIRAFWQGHRAVVRVTRGHLGLWRPKGTRWGTLRLTTVGRRTGQPRSVIIAYLHDGPDLVTMAMNGWDKPEPAWWLNLQAHPTATVETADGRREVTARKAQGEERERLWAQWGALDKGLDEYAARRPTQTAVVILHERASSDT
jgi:deazaflavin-dependent oxidoreductase (nitroreductase family)